MGRSCRRRLRYSLGHWLAITPLILDGEGEGEQCTNVGGGGTQQSIISRINKIKVNYFFYFSSYPYPLYQKRTDARLVVQSIPHCDTHRIPIAWRRRGCRGIAVIQP